MLGRLSNSASPHTGNDGGGGQRTTALKKKKGELERIVNNNKRQRRSKEGRKKKGIKKMTAFTKVDAQGGKRKGKDERKGGDKTF